MDTIYIMTRETITKNNIKNKKFQIKIGKSKNIKQRIKQIQTGYPYKLKYIFTYPTQYSTIIENKLKTDFKKYKCDGGTEWFEITLKNYYEIIYTIKRIDHKMFINNTL